MFYKIINRKKLAATRIADIIGYALWAPVLIFKKSAPPRKEAVREILVVRTAYLGDVIMTLPMLKPLKELFPEARITFLTANAAKDLFKANPYVDEVITYDAPWFYEKTEGLWGFLGRLRKRRFDLVIEARADIRDIFLIAYLSRAKHRISYKVGGGGFLLTGVVPYKQIKHRVDYHLDIVRYLGGQPGKLDWGINISEAESRKADLLLAKGGTSGLLIGIHPGGRKGLKCWPQERFAKLADDLIDRFGARVFFTGAPNEADLIGGIIAMMKGRAENLAGRADLRVAFALIGKLDLFITNDSGPLHIASAMSTPTVALFGPSKSNETGPYGNINRKVEKAFPCRQTCDEDVCNNPVKKECMDAVLVDDVFKAVTDVLRETGKASGGNLLTPNFERSKASVGDS